MAPASATPDMTDLAASSVSGGELNGVGVPPPQTIRVLAISVDAIERLALRRHLTGSEPAFDVTEAATPSECRAWLARSAFDIVVIGCHPADSSRFDLCRGIRGVPVITILARDDTAGPAQAMQAGAAQCLIKASERDHLLLLVDVVGRVAGASRARARSEAERRLFHAAFTCAPLAQMIVSDTAEIVRLNPAAARFLGVSRQELDGATLGRCLPGDVAAFVRRAFANPTDFDGKTGEFRLPVSSEPARPARIRLALVQPDPSAPRFALLQIEDVTGQVETTTSARAICTNPDDVDLRGGARSEHLVSGTRKLPLAESSVDGSHRDPLGLRQRVVPDRPDLPSDAAARGAVTGGIVHEFNNLLTAIIGNQQLVGFELPQAHPARPYLDEALAACRRAGELVQQMFRRSRETEGVPSSVCLRRLIEDSLPTWRAALQTGCRLEVRLADVCPPILGHPVQLADSVFFLLENAVARTPAAAPVELDLDRVEITPALRAREPRLNFSSAMCVQIRDHGPGSAADQTGHGSDPYQPGPATYTGIAAVYWLVKHHRGAILVDTGPGGTTVRVFLPLASAASSSRLESAQADSIPRFPVRLSP